MKYAFTATASREVRDVAFYYSLENRRLAVEFIEELDHVLALLLDNPRLGHPVGSIFRQIRLPRFPYYLFYTLDSSQELIEISVVCHQRRHPDYWQGRMEEGVIAYGVQSVGYHEQAEEEHAFRRAVATGVADLQAGHEVSLDEAKAQLGLT